LTGVFPSFDSIFIPQDKDVYSNEYFTELPHSTSLTEFDKPSPQISGWDAEALSDVSREWSNAKSPPPIVEGSISLWIRLNMSPWQWQSDLLLKF
jgi:hypothetical protein